MTSDAGTDGLKHSLFVDVDMSGSAFREVDLSGVKMRGVVLIGGDIDGAINGLRLNGVEVAPLIEAELNRLHPERAKLSPTTPEGMREAWTVVESMWSETMRLASTLPDDDLHRSIDDEWSFVQTLRHLVFVTDGWFGHAIVGRPEPFHRLALPASYDTGGADYGIDESATATFDEVVRVRDERMAEVKDFLSKVTQDDLDRMREPNPAPGSPPPAERTAIECLHVLFNEEWTHHQFAVRDLTIIRG